MLAQSIMTFSRVRSGCFVFKVLAGDDPPFPVDEPNCKKRNQVMRLLRRQLGHHHWRHSTLPLPISTQSPHFWMFYKVFRDGGDGETNS